MPVVSTKRVVGSIVAVSLSAAVGVGALSWYKHSRKKTRDQATTSELPTIEEENANMSVERNGRKDYRRTSSSQPSSPKKASTPLKKEISEDSISAKTEPEQEERMDVGANFSWSEAVENPDEAVRLLESKLSNVVLKDDEEDFEKRRRLSETERSSDKEGQEVHRVLSKKPVPASQISPASSSSSSSATSGKASNPNTVDSPFSASDIHSEASQDSGRGGSTNGVAGSMSPVGETDPIEAPPFYEFEIPKSIVGLIIGKKGVVIKDLTVKSGTFILIRDHHLKPDFKICSIEGTKDQINSCLRQIRRRFPPSRYPELNLNPVLPPAITSPSHPWGNGMIQLSLPEGIRSEVCLSCIVDAGHIFLQQPTHPSYPYLSKLDEYMMGIYSQEAGIPELPKPVEMGVICSAPSLGGWYRAMTCVYYEESDEVLLRFVDYGGYCRLPASDLKQIRSDFMSLPFQSTECYLNGVTPNEDMEDVWGQEAAALVHDLCAGKGLEVEVVSYASDGIPSVDLYVPSPNGQLIKIQDFLLEQGYAKATQDGESERKKTSETTKA